MTQFRTYPHVKTAPDFLDRLMGADRPVAPPPGAGRHHKAPKSVKLRRAASRWRRASRKRA